MQEDPKSASVNAHRHLGEGGNLEVGSVTGWPVCGEVDYMHASGNRRCDAGVRILHDHAARRRRAQAFRCKKHPLR